MPIQLGIPRALAFYEQGPFWLRYLQHLKVPFLLSEPTTAAMLNEGHRLAPTACLAQQLYVGHLTALPPVTTHVCLPVPQTCQAVQSPCPQAAGWQHFIHQVLPDAKDSFLPPPSTAGSWLEQYRNLAVQAHALECSPLNVFWAYHRAQRVNRADCSQLPYPGSIALLAHNYLLHDPLILEPLLQTLQLFARPVITSADLSPRLLLQQKLQLNDLPDSGLPDALAGAARFFSYQSRISGIVLLTNEACPFDSQRQHYLEQHIFRPSTKPYLCLSLGSPFCPQTLVRQLTFFLHTLSSL